MANYNKNKGKGFERDVAKHLTSIFKAFGDEYNFMRVPNSGAFTGGKNFVRQSSITAGQSLLMTGDIIVPEKLSKMSIECKFYKDIAWHQIIQGKCKQLDKWIKQAKDTNKPLWFLIFKINQCGAFVVTDSLAFRRYLTDYALYKDVLITSMDNFFERTKDHIINEQAHLEQKV